MSMQIPVRRGATLLGMCLAAVALSACQSYTHPGTASGAMGASGTYNQRAHAGPGTVMPSGTQGPPASGTSATGTGK